MSHKLAHGMKTWKGIVELNLHNGLSAIFKKRHWVVILNDLFLSWLTFFIITCLNERIYVNKSPLKKFLLDY
jgi:hypothetical protein